MHSWSWFCLFPLGSLTVWYGTADGRRATLDVSDPLDSITEFLITIPTRWLLVPLTTVSSCAVAGELGQTV
jgi:hypothetical protein